MIHDDDNFMSNYRTFYLIIFTTVIHDDELRLKYVNKLSQLETSHVVKY